MTPPLDSRPRRSGGWRSRRPRRPSLSTVDLRAVAVAVAVALAVTVTASLPVAIGLPSPTAASPRDEPSTVVEQVPPVEADVRAYLGTRSTRAAVVVRDLVTDREYRYRPDARYDSASVVKVAILAAVLHQAEQQDRDLTSRERQLLAAMIRQSSNDAASTLWNAIGRGAGLEEFLAAAGMSRTAAGPAGYWGVSRITAADQVLLMGHLTGPTGLLSEARRRFALRLMGSVEDSQDWGVSAGPPARDVTIELKNGWLPRGSDGWAVHSVGHVRGEGRDYLIAVLTVGSTTRKAGIDTVEGVSRLVWADLAPR